MKMEKCRKNRSIITICYCPMIKLIEKLKIVSPSPFLGQYHRITIRFEFEQKQRYDSFQRVLCGRHKDPIYYYCYNSSRGNHGNSFWVLCPGNFYNRTNTTLMRQSEVSQTIVFRDHKLRGNRLFCRVNIFSSSTHVLGDRSERFPRSLSTPYRPKWP